MAYFSRTLLTCNNLLPDSLVRRRMANSASKTSAVSAATPAPVVVVRVLGLSISPLVGVAIRPTEWPPRTTS